MNDTDMKALLKQLLIDLDDSTKWLKRSYELCKETGIKEKYTDDEFDNFENLTSRFGRTTDFLINKVYRAIDKAELETSGTVIDTINRAAKRGLIESANQLKEIKELRNEISHEYASRDLKDIFEATLAYVPQLFDYCEKAKEYCQKYA